MSIDPILIRPMGTDDVEPVALLLTRLYQEMGIEPPVEGHVLADRLKDLGTGTHPNFYALIAFHKARASGLLLYSKTFDPVFASMGICVSALYVAPPARGKKIGETLMVRLAQIALRSRWSHIEWSTKLAQRHSIPFVDKHFNTYHKAHSRVLFGEDLSMWAKQLIVHHNDQREAS